MTTPRLLANLCGVAASLSVTALAQQPAEPLRFEGARAEVYKRIGDVELVLHVFAPAAAEARDEVVARGGAETGAGPRRPAIVFFFGGGWTGGSPQQFVPHCRYLTDRGMVAMAADYRVASRHGTKALQCVADGKSAVRWIRSNAARLGVDPDRIVAAGGSAGGHVAACTGVIAGLDEAGEDAEVSSRPDAMVLFNPVLVLAPIAESEFADPQQFARWRKRLGTEPEQLSPYHHVRGDLPPCLILHGTADRTVPFATAELFTAAMRQAGNTCRLAAFPDAGHGFFNQGRGDGTAYRETVAQMDAFLVELGYLDAGR